VASHPKPSARNAEGDTPKRPSTWADFDRTVERAVTTPLENTLQNRSKNQVPLIPPIVPETVFIEVRLQIFLTHMVIGPADTTLY
jgi:hypothetical protein